MANPRLRPLTWWRKWAKKDWAIATIGFTSIIFLLSFFFDSRTEADSAVHPPLIPSTTNTVDLVDLTLLRNAKDRGAFCLDGSLPAYHFQRGSGSGSNSWVLHIEGGGWCNTFASCAYRKTTKLGSSNFMQQVSFHGILSSNPSENPDFFNWNRVKIRYCDGASFAGHPENELKNTTRLFFRGQLIWEALMDELLSIGLSSAKQALLSGCSAGGLATLIHCDNFRDHLRKDIPVKCLADAGFFLDEPDILGNDTMRSFYHDVVHLQAVAKSLHKNCVDKMEPFKCLFPQEMVKNIRTPVFLVNPAYDFWQIQNILVPDVSDPYHYWAKCRLNIHNCNHSQMEVLQGFRSSLLKTVDEFLLNNRNGVFIDSCFIHCQTSMGETWHSPSSPRINNSVRKILTSISG